MQCLCRMPGTRAAQSDPEPELARPALGWRLGVVAAVHLHQGVAKGSLKAQKQQTEE